MKIAVIGAGWYGCHISKVLKGIGIEIDIYEKSDKIFKHASGNNQNRLHQGFHYSRNHKTRRQTVDGFNKFLKHYGFLTKEIRNNLYAVPLKESLIDFHTYFSIMISSGLLFDREFEFCKSLRNIEGILNTNERVILIEKSRSFFLDELKDYLKVSTPVNLNLIDPNKPMIEGIKYDFLIDCTWGHGLNNKDIFFEPTLLLYYKCYLKEHPALTFVDGELPSIYPTENESLWTLSHVKHTPLGQFNNPQEAKSRLTNIQTNEIENRKYLMEKDISYYYPDFSDKFKFKDVQLAIKTKPFGLNANRSCEIRNQDRIISIMSGKIDTIFTASDEILHLIGS